LVWMMLDKKGNSNTRERCELCNRFLEIFGDLRSCTIPKSFK
jgi:hypothetical protein